MDSQQRWLSGLRCAICGQSASVDVEKWGIPNAIDTDTNSRAPICHACARRYARLNTAGEYGLSFATVRESIECECFRQRQSNLISNFILAIVQGEGCVLFDKRDRSMIVTSDSPIDNRAGLQVCRMEPSDLPNDWEWQDAIRVAMQAFHIK